MNNNIKNNDKDNHTFKPRVVTLDNGTHIPNDVKNRIFNILISETFLKLVFKYEKELLSNILFYIVNDKDETRVTSRSLVNINKLLDSLTLINSNHLLDADMRQFLNPQIKSEEETINVCLLVLPSDMNLDPELISYKFNKTDLFHISNPNYPILLGNRPKNIIENDGYSQKVIIKKFKSICFNPEFISYLDSHNRNNLPIVIFRSQDCDLIYLDLSQIKTFYRKYLMHKSYYTQLQEALSKNTNTILLTMGNYYSQHQLIIHYEKHDMHYTFEVYIF